MSGDAEGTGSADDPLCVGLDEMAGGKELNTGQTWHLSVLWLRFAQVLEVEDVHFNHDSAVLLADYRDTAATDDDDSPDAQDDHQDTRITGLAIVASILRWSEEHPDQKVLITGHTDRSGSDSYNLGLSLKRAKNVLFLLTNDKEEWAKASNDHDKTEDHQQLLKWLYEDDAWVGCDPGPINNQANATTKAAVEEFQRQYNTKFSPAEELVDDGIVGEKTWGAFYDVYMKELRQILDTDEAGLAALQEAFGGRFLEESQQAVGCGENWPITDEQRSRIDRRVEILFFDPSEALAADELPLACHPSETTCRPDDCLLRNANRYTLQPVPVTPILRPRYRVRVHLQLTWKDPEGTAHPFPKDFPLKLTFGDGSPAREMTVPEGGILDFIVDNRQQSFTIEFHPGAEQYLVSPPAGSTDPEQLLAKADVGLPVRNGSRAFLLPASFTLDDTDWTITGAPNYTAPNFVLTEDDPTPIGTHASPCVAELNCHWQFMKFLYCDRRLGQVLSLPPLMVEGYCDKDAADGAPDTQSNWLTATEGCQGLPWILRKRDGAELNKPDEKILIQFRCKPNTFVDTTAGTVGDRKLVTKDAGSPSDDPGCNEGENTAVDFGVANGERVSYYDLPPCWRSKTWHTRLSGGTGAPAAKMGRFETLAGEATTDAQPLLFSLDDMVLVDVAGNPLTDISWGATCPPKDRLALFCNTFARSGPSQSDLSQSGLYKPDGKAYIGAGAPNAFTTNNLAFFTQLPQAATGELDRNYIVDYPQWTRVIFCRGNAFDVFDERLSDASADLVGARAARLRKDVFDGTDWSEPRSGRPRARNQSDLAVAKSTFFDVQPQFEQEHEFFSYIGKVDMIRVRCCGVEADGTELGACLNYFRFFFNFTPDWKPNKSKDEKKHIHPSGVAAGDQKEWAEKALYELLRRWNGPESTSGTENTGDAHVVSLDPAHKHKSRAMWFAQDLPKDVAHFELGVFRDDRAGEDVRAYMWSIKGEGVLDVGDNAVLGSGWFTFAHEVGHGGSLVDEYVEATRWYAPPGSGLSSLPGFDCMSAGSPFRDDGNSIMSGNKEVRARHYWHMAEWYRWLEGDSREFEVQYRGYHYSLPHMTEADKDAPFRNHIGWPLNQKKNVEHGSHGKCDIYLYPLGEDRYSAWLLRTRSQASGQPLPPKFDGIILVHVQCNFDHHSSTVATIFNWLNDVDGLVNSAYNHTFKVSGSYGGKAYANILLHFEMRFKADDFSDVDHKDSSEHIKVEVKGGGDVNFGPAWDSGVFSNDHKLIIGDNKKADFPDYFCEMVGLTQGTEGTAASYQRLVREVMPGATVAKINP